MLAYYFDLALRSFRSSRALSLLMVLALGLGIGACMTTLTVFHVLSGDPIPAKSARLVNVQLDAGSMAGHKPGQEPQFQLTRFDAEALLRDGKAKRQALMTGSNLPVIPESPALKPFYAAARQTSADFFAMFDVPFRFGAGWDAAADAAQARVVVLSRELNDKLFGGVNSVGRNVRLRETDFRVIGVLADWRPVPHFYDTTLGDYAPAEDVYLPFSTARAVKFGSSGNMNCWDSQGPEGPRDINAPCAWVQYWAELESAAQVPEYKRYLEQYSEDQRKAGRFARPVNVRVRNVVEWLVHVETLPGDVKLQVWLALGFLLVCLTNTVGLLLAKTLRRSGEIGVRRALGATKGAIFGQFVVEAGALGLAGGIVGLGLAWCGLWLVRQSPADYAPLAQLDAPMLALSFALALVASVLAGLLPAWHAAGVTPAQQLKTQ